MIEQNKINEFNCFIHAATFSKIGLKKKSLINNTFS